MSERLDNQRLARVAESAPVAASVEMTVTDAVGFVVRVWRDDDPRADQTVTRMGEIALRFAGRLAATGIRRLDEVSAADCDGFVHAPTRSGQRPSVPTQHFRRVTLRAVFRTLRNSGVPVGDPTIDLALEAKSKRKARPLSNDEVVLCRTVTLPARAASQRRPAAWALAEATASTGEIPQIRIRDLDSTADPGRVTLPGSRRLNPRTVTFTGWGRNTIRRRIDELAATDRTGSDEPLVYEGTGAPGTVRQQAAACGLIGVVLATVRLNREPDVRPASVRHWRGRSAYDAGAAISDVACLLGYRSLDETAAAIALDWRRTR